LRAFVFLARLVQVWGSGHALVKGQFCVGADARRRGAALAAQLDVEAQPGLL
jgi:hypothetical protein